MAGQLINSSYLRAIDFSSLNPTNGNIYMLTNPLLSMITAAGALLTCQCTLTDSSAEIRVMRLNAWDHYTHAPLNLYCSTDQYNSRMAIVTDLVALS